MALFGTDGARGVANQDLTIELAAQIGGAAAGLLPPGSTVLIGRDTRTSGTMLEAALTAGFTAAGIRVFLVGVVPTPALAYLIGSMGAEAGVMISASHNPPQYNGIKLLDRQGRKWENEREREVERRVYENALGPVSPTRIGQVFHYGEAAVQAYHQYLLGIFGGRIPALRVVVDVGHGAALTTAPVVLERLGAFVTVIHGEPDGSRINQGCGATHPEVVRESVLKEQADVGLSFDGDADRLIAVDGTGHIVDGDEILYVLATGMKRRGQLPQNLVVSTVMSNLGVERALTRNGIQLMRTPVGDRWVAEAMREHGAGIGGEQSGHVILRQWAETGDGLLTALALLEEIGQGGKSLNELVSPVERYPQVLHNVPLPHSFDDWHQIPGLTAEVEAAERDLGLEGRVLIRPSGTEPLMRIMIEGRDREQIEKWAHRLSVVVQNALESAKA